MFYIKANMMTEKFSQESKAWLNIPHKQMKRVVANFLIFGDPSSKTALSKC